MPRLASRTTAPVSRAVELSSVSAHTWGHQLPLIARSLLLHGDEGLSKPRIHGVPFAAESCKGESKS